MNTSREPLYHVLQESERANRKRQSIRAVLIVLALIGFGVLMVVLNVAINNSAVP